MEAFEEITEDDYILQSCGPLGGRMSVSQHGRYLGDFAEELDAETFVKDHMRSNGFYPNVWYISDHGNATLITL